MDSPPDKYLHFQMPSFLPQDHMIFPSHADQPQKYYPFQHVHMSHRPFEFESQQDEHSFHVESPHSALTPPFSTLSQHIMYSPHPGLSLYSASGFDMLSILAKVATRPNPLIMLGPVDMTCSFVVADVRSGDAPIVYASPTFCSLTGYTEAEVLGRNCRFLQSPGGSVQQGDSRHHTAPEAVRQLYRSIIQEKECQTSLINYRKDGTAFVNLVTLIPICADDDDLGTVTHFVGFQVDLAEQPSAIMQKLRDGSYIVNYSTASMRRGGISTLGGIGGIRRARGVSTELVEILRRGDATTPSEGGSVAGASPPNGPSSTLRDTGTDVQSFVLANTDDFIHVLSLKGSFLYVAPSISRVLGYTSTELIGRSISDLCHPVDLIPVMRELKEASSSSNTNSQRPSGSNGSSPTIGASSAAFRFAPHHPQLYPAPFPYPHSHLHHPHPLHMVPNAPHIYPRQFAPFTVPQPPQPIPRSVTSLLFRARHKLGHYVWLLCRGSLHVEPGKGRKAVVMVGRVIRGAVVEGLMEREMLSERGAEGAREQGSRTEWGIVAPNGIILSGVQSLAPPSESRGNTSPKEGTAAVEPTSQAIGRTLASFMSSQADARRVGEVLAGAACAEEAGMKRVRCVLSASGEEVELRFYAVGRQAQMDETGVVKGGLRLPAGVVFEVAWVTDGESGSEDVEAQAQQQNITATSFAVPPNHATFGAHMQAQASTPASPSLNVVPGATAYSPTHIQAPTQLSAQHASSSGSSSRNAISRTSYSPTSQSTFPMQSHSHAISHLAIPSPRSSSSSSPSNMGTPLVASTFSQQHASIITSRTGNSSPDSAGSSSASPYPLPPLSLSSLSETSWKYELTRLRFENERLRAEAAKLERKERRRGHASGPAVGVGSFPLMGSGNSNSQAVGMKRPRED